MSETWTIGRLLNWTTQHFKQHGSSSPRLDAEVLLAEARGCPRIQLYTAFDEEPAEEVKAKFREWVKRRAAGAPVAYLVGHREFFSLSFKVSPAVLIPRPETEFLVIALVDRLRESGHAVSAPRIVDVGTGSGIVAVCTAKQLPAARLTAIDLSPQALEIARENAASHGVAERIEFLEGDLLAGLPEEPLREAIVSNPPYISTAEMGRLAREVVEHEPRLALEAGPLGTEVIERLIPQAAVRLKPGGWLLMEISPMLEAAVAELLGQEPRLEIMPTIRDLAGHPRVVQARRRP